MNDGDENSKSLVLITSVGSTPTTGISKSRLDSLKSEWLSSFVTHFLTHF